MANREKVSLGGKYEDIIGYSRAVKAGKMIFVSGTASVNPSRKASDDEPYMQCKGAMKIIEQAIQKLGGSLEDVVRTRVFIRSDVDWKLVAKAHKEYFDDIRPASTMLFCNFLDPNILVEIEVDAIVDRET